MHLKIRLRHNNRFVTANEISLFCHGNACYQNIIPWTSGSVFHIVDQPSESSVNSFAVCRFLICYNFQRVTGLQQKQFTQWATFSRRKKVNNEDRLADLSLSAARTSSVAAGVAPPLVLSVATGDFPTSRRCSSTTPARGAAVAVRDPTHTVYPGSSASFPKPRDGTLSPSPPRLRFYRRCGRTRSAAAVRRGLGR